MRIGEKKKLLKSYNDIKELLIKKIDSTDCEVDVEGDLVDKIQGDAISSVQSKLHDNYILKLRAINKALKQIENDDYGKCEECEEDIKFKRLEAFPGVTLCISCAEQAEIKR